MILDESYSDLVLKKKCFLLFSMLKTIVLFNIFVETVIILNWKPEIPVVFVIFVFTFE